MAQSTSFPGPPSAYNASQRPDESTKRFDGTTGPPEKKKAPAPNRAISQPSPAMAIPRLRKGPPPPAYFVRRRSERPLNQRRGGLIFPPQECVPEKLSTNYSPPQVPPKEGHLPFPEPRGPGIPAPPRTGIKENPLPNFPTLEKFTQNFSAKPSFPRNVPEMGVQAPRCARKGPKLIPKKLAEALENRPFETLEKNRHLGSFGPPAQKFPPRPPMTPECPFARNSESRFKQGLTTKKFFDRYCRVAHNPTTKIRRAKGPWTKGRRDFPPGLTGPEFGRNWPLRPLTMIHETPRTPNPAPPLALTAPKEKSHIDRLPVPRFDGPPGPSNGTVRAKPIIEPACQKKKKARMAAGKNTGRGQRADRGIEFMKTTWGDLPGPKRPPSKKKGKIRGPKRE